MASRIKIMTEGKPVSLIISFALPLMIGNVFQQLYTVVDTMVVGKALGVEMLAALGASDWLNWMMLGLIQGLTQGLRHPDGTEVRRKRVRQPEKRDWLLRDPVRRRCCGVPASGTASGAASPAAASNAR